MIATEYIVAVGEDGQVILPEEVGREISSFHIQMEFEEGELVVRAVPK